MNNAVNNCFIPVLTVMVDYGNAPFLWRVNRPDEAGIGGNLCDSSYWGTSFPISEGLWRKFADWAIEFEQINFDYRNNNVETNSWSWVAFHTRGLQLARWLKEDVGDAYRVVYYKPIEDPNHDIDERTEILSGGELMPLPPWHQPIPDPHRFCQRIVSGGQTGVDRAALDFAICNDYTHGGWAPSGREAEDGLIPLKYQLSEMREGGYRQRTKRNVQDSDGTLIMNLGVLEGGTLLTQVCAKKSEKPLFLLQLDGDVSVDTTKSVLAWIQGNTINTLNVAGPRESKRPGIYQKIMKFLEAMHQIWIWHTMGSINSRSLNVQAMPFADVVAVYEDRYGGSLSQLTKVATQFGLITCLECDLRSALATGLQVTNLESYVLDALNFKAEAK